MDRINKCREEFLSWCKNAHVCSVSDVNDTIGNIGASGLITLCEARYSEELTEAAKRIKSARKRLVLIAGPSSSGKTTTAARLKSQLHSLGINAVPISLDDYYMDKALMPKNADGEPDYEALASIDYRLFNKTVEALANGEEAVLPAYDFMRSRIIKNAQTLRLHENDVIITEGIHGLNPLIAHNIPDSQKFRIYCAPVSAMDDAAGRHISSRTIRMARRLIRDHYFRNTDYKRTFELWTNQELSAEKNIYPYTDSADVILNTSLPYELCVYRDYLLNEVLGSASDTDENIETIAYLRGLVSELLPISRELVPENSIVREFV